MDWIKGFQTKYPGSRTIRNTLLENAGQNEWKLYISKEIYRKYWTNNKLT